MLAMHHCKQHRHIQTHTKPSRHAYGSAPMRSEVPPWGTRTTGTLGPHDPAATHAGLAGGAAADPSSRPHDGSGRAVAFTIDGHALWLNGAAFGASP